MHALARELWPIHRSITGNGVRQTLAILKRELPDLVIHEVPTGTQVFDWIVPDEWTISGARLTGPSGETVVDYSDSNLHVVGYSDPVDAVLSKQELEEHLHSIEDQPTAIPFVTSYYHDRWGFCLPHTLRKDLPDGEYHAVIDAQKEPGSLSFGELIIPGEARDEIFLSTYICHPSLANNELSGPVVAVALARHIMAMPSRHYTYRIVFVPESIGALTYSSIRLQELKERVIAGFQLTCIGDDRSHTYIASRDGNTRIDRTARRVVQSLPNPVEYSYLARGSDERTYCAPGIDLPHVSVIRSRYADYPEYHTSLDDLENVVTPAGLQGGFDAVRMCIEELETEPVLVAKQKGEPQLGRRGLYHTLLNKNTPEDVMLRTNILAYADGQHSIKDLSELLGVPEGHVGEVAEQLKDYDLLELTHQSAECTR